MSELKKTFEDNPVDRVWNKKRLVLGVSFFVLGVIFLFSGVLVATSDFYSLVVSLSMYKSWKVGGILAGLGAPLTVLGVLSLLPSRRNTLLLATLGSLVCLLGVLLFWYSFPTRWYGDPQNLAPVVSVVYLVGSALTQWSLLVGIANVKLRNNPGGTVLLDVEVEGEEKTVEVSEDKLMGRGGIGVFGDRRGTSVETQTGGRRQN